MRLVIVESPFQAPSAKLLCACGLKLWSPWGENLRVFSMNKRPCGRCWDVGNEGFERLRYARAALRDCLLRGEAPIASHLLYTQPGVLSDAEPAERAMGIAAGLAWGEKAELTAVYDELGISPGMEHGIEQAKAAGRPIEFRQIAGRRK